MSFDINKPYRTRDGREAWAVRPPEKVGSRWASELSTFIGYVKTDSGNACYGWNEDGTIAINEDRTLDLVNIPERRTVKVWINVYPSESERILAAYSTRRLADDWAMGCDRLACIEREISFDVGEGL